MPADSQWKRPDGDDDDEDEVPFNKELYLGMDNVIVVDNLPIVPPEKVFLLLSDACWCYLCMWFSEQDVDPLKRGDQLFKNV